uniref:Uncharacterized protein n=1 Tax=Heterorhabditis bacteriophora TaxID=37862 RepID=A0A1I7WEH1_HETBA
MLLTIVLLVFSPHGVLTPINSCHRNYSRSEFWKWAQYDSILRIFIFKS